MSTSKSSARSVRGTHAAHGAHSGAVYNGMPALDLGEHGWESPWSGPNGGQCVQTKQLSDGRVAVRQSTDPAGPALIYTPQEMAAFVAGVKRGLADHLAAG
ncbi:hypothetical protein B0E37_06061 [Streptomyces sp. MH192]|nr:hypothetical protein [Streptomyces sp. MH192]MCF0103509.1 hypothetical protein [Streptomyces sp. MH191]